MYEAIPLTRKGSVESRLTLEIGGPPRLDSSCKGSAGLPSGLLMLRLLRSMEPRILGSIPAYSSTKMGTRAPMMASADRARAPNSDRVMMAAHFLHSGRLSGSRGSGVGIGTHRICPLTKSCVEPDTWAVVAATPAPFLSHNTSSILSLWLAIFRLLLLLLHVC